MMHSTPRQGIATADEGFVRHYLLYLLAAASESVSSEFHARVRTHGLRVPEWRVLACLADTDGQMVTQLASLALMEQSRLTKIVDQMAAKGFVTRRSDDRDRRRVRVFLTADGRKLAGRLVGEAREHEAGIIEQITSEKAAALKDVLSTIIELHAAGPGDASPPQGDRPQGEDE